ncbi:hypothetical protein CRG98_021782 [Punica granatum]|uniref:Uncharacterized protein n=1 Tax=Punica granatum TaxID=22663 RepID=A0A2I0JQT6_PUNGR|nr:hypothetical protein CRG98_021782 [Punica granatum]
MRAHGRYPLEGAVSLPSSSEGMRKGSGSRRKRPYGSVVSRETYGYPHCKGAERSLGSPEASNLLFHDVVCFS